MSPRQYFYSDVISMAEKLAAEIAENLTKAVEERDRGFLILPGGRSPVALMQNLATKNLPWDKIDITTTDERQVPEEDDASCAGQARRILGKGNIHWLGQGLPDWQWPSDVTVLGMGMDGHYASIFPDTKVAPDARVIESIAPFAPTKRWSLAPAILTNTRRLILLIPDTSKFELCKNILTGQGGTMPISKLLSAEEGKIELHIAVTGQ